MRGDHAQRAEPWGLAFEPNLSDEVSSELEVLVPAADPESFYRDEGSFSECLSVRCLFRQSVSDLAPILTAA